jgi:CRP/FNR family transcriptional regulator
MLPEEMAAAFGRCFPFWCSLNDGEKEYLLQHTVRISVPKGTNVYCTDESYFGIFLIAEGALRTYILSEDGRDITLYRLSRGEVGHISANGVLGNLVFEVNIETERDCVFYLIPPEAYQHISSQVPSMKLYTYQIAASRYSDIMFTLQEILFYSFDKRLASFLIDETIHTGCDTIYMTHEQIAKYVSSAREVVSRMLKYFAKEGLIESSRGSIRILDKQRLRKLTE